MTAPRRRGGGGARNPASLGNLRRGETPAPPGNTYTRTHGAYARLLADRVEGKVAEVFGALSEDAPLRGEGGGLPAHDGAVVRLAAAALCRLEDVEAHLRDRGLLDADGNVRPAVDLERRLRVEALGYLAELGMTPTSRARLGLDLTRTASVASAMSEPNRARRRELLAQAGVELDDDDEEEQR